MGKWRSWTRRRRCSARGTAALNATIAELRQLPVTLGQHTSHYIAEGVRKAIQDDFTRPIASAVSGPMAELHRTAHEARLAIGEVRSESKFQSWTWVAIIVLLGVVLGMTGSYFFYTRDVGRINDRIDSLQQQIAPPAPIVRREAAGREGGQGQERALSAPGRSVSERRRAGYGFDAQALGTRIMPRVPQNHSHDAE